MRFAGLVLAGSRGPDDPVAAAAGVSHKALAPVAGRPMIARVLETLAAVPAVERTAVMIERPELLSALPELRDAIAGGRLTVLPASASPSLSALDGFEALGGGARRPVIMTTADNCLLTPAMLETFLARLPAGADVIAALARAETIRAAYPEALRTYLRFSDGGRSGCNLFAFLTPDAARAIAFWRRLEQERKRPLAMLRHLGPGAILRYAAGRLSLGQALDALGRRSGTRLAAVEMPFAESAIDVDKPQDMALAERILRTREQG